MAFDINAPLNGLRRQLPGSDLEVPQGMSADLQHYALLQQLKDEAEDRANKYTMAKDPAAAAFQGLANQYGGDIAKTNVEKARPGQEEFEAAQRKALLAGFGNSGDTPSAQAGQYGRAKEMAAINAPGQAAVAAARAKAAGDLEVAKVNQKPYESLLGLFGSDGSGAQLQPGDTVSIPGLVSMHRGGNQKDPVSATLMSQLAKAREELQTANSGLFSSFTGAGQAKQAKVDQLVADIINQHPAANEVKDLVHQVAGNPKIAGLPFSQILSRVGGDQMSPAEVDQFRDLLNIVRGKDF